MADRPNILWFCTDQQRADTIHSLGNPHIRTPSIDRLAADGIAFNRAYCTSPICTPSRVSFLTGRYPRTTRARWNANTEFPADEVLITRLLADSGYDCGLVGKLHIAGADKRVEPRVNDGYRVFLWSHHPMPDWPESDYTKWLAEKGESWERHYHVPPESRHAYAGMPAELHQTTWCAEKCIQFISEPHDGPWLMSVNVFDPHHPLDPPKEYLDRYDPDSLPLPLYREGELENKPKFQQIHKGRQTYGQAVSGLELSDRQKRECTAAYYAMIELIDDQFGRIMAALEDTGQLDNTIVIFTSDHGELMGDHGIYWKGCYFYEGLVRVPLIVSWPGRLPSHRSDALVELHDLAPSILELAGIEVPDRMQAKSLLPILTGETDHHRDHVLCEYYRALGYAPLDANGTMLFDGRYKICVYHESEPGELYDLQTDPGEFDNLWDKPEFADLKMHMLKRCFDAAVVQTLDPWPPQMGRY